MSARHRASAQPVSLPTGSGFAAAIVRPRTIRAKLIRILLISLVLILGLLSVMAVGQVRSYSGAAEVSDAVRLELAAQDLVHQLQRERGMTNGMLNGDARFRAGVIGQRPATDQALQVLDRLATDARIPGSDQVTTAVAGLASLDGTRHAVDSGHAEPSAVFTFYTDAIAALNRLDLGLDRASDQGLRHGLQALAALGDAKEGLAQERGRLSGVFAAGGFAADDYIRFTEVRAGKQAALVEFDRWADARQRTELDAALKSTAAIQVSGLESAALGGNDSLRAHPVNPQDWWTSATTVIDDLRAVQQSVGSDIQARTAALRRAATYRLATFLLIAFAVVVLQVALTVGCLRSVTRPLRALAGEADAAASWGLPAAVARVRTATDDTDTAPPPRVRVPRPAGTEILAVAAALDRIQGTAFELASAEAVLRRTTTESLVNLGRRNQNLVRRQLGFISKLEHEESDPTALANLFELDHLATRMRRNAESLLVLAGQSSPRPWSTPLPVTDIVRAALSEVEDYRRVTLRRIEDAQIGGAAVAEVAHMLAELIENALSFSPPHLDVEVQGKRTPDGYLIAVVDHGVGLTAPALAEANSRLRGSDTFLAAPTQFLGHYVVGQLAKKRNIDVRLVDSPAGGVTARIHLPAALLAEAAVVDTGPAPATAAMPQAEPAGSAAKSEPEAARGATLAGYTKNGLTKRVTTHTVRTVRTVPAASTAAVAGAGPEVSAGPDVTRSPREVGAMLAGFRSSYEQAAHRATDSREGGSP